MKKQLSFLFVFIFCKFLFSVKAKKTLLLSLMLVFSRCVFCQPTAVDFFCNENHYLLTAGKTSSNTFHIKVIGPNQKTISLGKEKKQWEELRQSKQAELIINKAKETGILMSQASIIEIGTFVVSSQSVVVKFYDTISFPGMRDINALGLADVISTKFKSTFSECSSSIDFGRLLSNLEAKYKSLAPNTDQQQSITDVLESGFGVGIGLGPNFNTSWTYDYYVSPYDTTLHKDRLNNPSFVASLLIIWNPIYTYRKHMKGDENGTFTSPEYNAPGWWGIGVGFNFAEVNPNDMKFNLRLSGGVGLLGNLGGGLQVGTFFDLSQQQTLRKDMEAYLGKKYPFDDPSNLSPRLFTNQFIPSVSFKVIYKFKAGGKPLEQRDRVDK